MAVYPVRTIYYFDQLVEAETAEEAMLKGEANEPDEAYMDHFGLVHIDRTADNKPLTVREVATKLTPEPIY